MKLVVDANILIAALIVQGKTAELLFDDRIQCIAPLYILNEIEKHQDEILKKTLQSNPALKHALDVVSKRITFQPSSSNYLVLAKKISPDPNDVEYFALAILDKCPIWSNDKLLKQQDQIRIISTKELIEELATSN